MSYVKWLDHMHSGFKMFQEPIDWPSSKSVRRSVPGRGQSAATPLSSSDQTCAGENIGLNPFIHVAPKSFQARC